MRQLRFLIFLMCWISIAAPVSTFAEKAIKSSPKLPETSPWNVKALGTAPKFEWIDDKAPVRSLFYAGESYGGKPTRVFAYYASPGTLSGDDSKDKDLPAVVLIHGGGGTAFAEWAKLWAERGYAAIAMDLAGYQPIEGKNPHARNSRKRLGDGGPDQGDNEKFGSVDKAPREQWPYHAVANVVLAHSLIRSFKGVDSDRTAVTGISWGGYLTCIVAGVDDRFKAAVPVYGCGFLHDNSAWLGRFSKMNDGQRERWVKLWDPSRYLPAVSMPILFVNGTNDFAYPLDSYMKSFDAVPNAKQLCITVNMKHGHQAGWAPKEIGLFIDQHLRDGTPLSVLGDIRIKEGQLKLAIKSSTKLVSAALHHTTDTSAINKRTWITTPARIASSLVIAPAAPANATAWFVTVEDERGATVSTRVMLDTESKK